MSGFFVHREPFCRHHCVDVASKAFVFVAFSWVFQALFPLFLCTESAGFWKTRSVFHEKPVVKFTGQVLLMADVDNEKNERDLLVYSSFERFAEAYDPYLRIPFIQSSEEDVDGDGRVDHLKIDFRLPLQQNERVRELSVLLLFSYSLHDWVRLEMDALALVQTGLLGVRRLRTPPTQYDIRTVGHLETQQWEPLPHAASGTLTPFKIGHLLGGTDDDPAPFSLPDLISSYLTAGRNLTTRYSALQSFFDARHAPGEERRVTASVHVRYPAEVGFEYWTGLPELFKWAWVQYLAALCPVYVFVRWVKGGLFRSRVFAQVVVDDVPSLAGSGCTFPTVTG